MPDPKTGDGRCGMSGEKMIMQDSPEAASIQTVAGWVSRRGHFFGSGPDAERMARFDGCTHRKCEQCGEPIPVHSWCVPCHAKKEIEEYEKKQRRPWNGTDVLYSQSDDRYFFDADELDQYCEDVSVTPDSLRLIICAPTYAGEIDPDDHYCNDLPEEGEVPAEVREAFDELNARLRAWKTILSWSPGKYAAEMKSLSTSEPGKVLSP